MGIFAAKKEIGPDTVLQRNKDILFNQIDGEVVMLSVENNEYYGMDSIGSKIWELLAHPIKVAHIIFALLKEYEVSYEICTRDVISFLSSLFEKKIIRIC